MKRGLLPAALLLFGMSSVNSQAQDSLIVYYGKLDNVTGKDSARYYRKCVEKGDMLFFNQYDVENNKLQLSGSYRLIDTVKEGHFVEYYKTGNKKAEGDYFDNIQVDLWTTWYEDGTISSKEIYLGNVEDILKVIKQDSVIRTKHVRQFKKKGYNGIRHGLSVWYHKNGKISAKEVYKEGKIIDARFWDELGNIQTIEIKDVYENTTQPQFKHGDLMNFLQKSIYYPTTSWEKGIRGQVVVVFAVDVDGSVVDYEIKKSLGNKEIDLMAIRAVKLLDQRFIPGISHNRIMKMYFTLPISFRQ